MIIRREAINNLRPGAEFTLLGDKLEWNDTKQTEPSLEEIEAEIKRLNDEYDNNEYQRERASSYPSFADQLDLLYHGGYDAWKAVIQEVKEKYPKP